MSAAELVLASASPRRRELLQQLGVQFSLDSADIDESRAPREPPLVYVERMAREKAEAVYQRHGDGSTLVLAADTTVVIRGQVLGKPRDMADGMDMLGRLSGRRHWVFTAICLRHAGGSDAELVGTEVRFVKLSPETCAAYLATEEPWDKAGAYAIQGVGGAFVSAIRGSYSNVVGLPLSETWQMLRKHGVGTALERPDE